MTAINANMDDTQDWLPLSEADAEVLERGFYTVDGENLEVGGVHPVNLPSGSLGQLDSGRWGRLVDGRYVKRGVAGSIAASHTSGATLTRYYPEAPRGTSGVFSISDEVTLDDEDIKALPSTAIEVVPSPGSGKMIVPLVAYLTSDFAVAYSGADADGSYLGVDQLTLIENFTGSPTQEASTELSGFLAFTSGKIVWPLYQRQKVLGLDAVAGTKFTTGGGITADPGGYEATALNISAGNGLNFGGGDAANTLKVRVVYITVDV